MNVLGGRREGERSLRHYGPIHSTRHISLPNPVSPQSRLVDTIAEVLAGLKSAPPAVIFTYTEDDAFRPSRSEPTTHPHDAEASSRPSTVMYIMAAVGIDAARWALRDPGTPMHEVLLAVVRCFPPPADRPDNGVCISIKPGFSEIVPLDAHLLQIVEAAGFNAQGILNLPGKYGGKYVLRPVPSADEAHSSSDRAIVEAHTFAIPDGTEFEYFISPAFALAASVEQGALARGGTSELPAHSAAFDRFLTEKSDPLASLLAKEARAALHAKSQDAAAPALGSQLSLAMKRLHSKDLDWRPLLPRQLSNVEGAFSVAFFVEIDSAANFLETDVIYIAYELSLPVGGGWSLVDDSDGDFASDAYDIVKQPTALAAAEQPDASTQHSTTTGGLRNRRPQFAAAGGAAADMYNTDPPPIRSNGAFSSVIAEDAAFARAAARRRVAGVTQVAYQAVSKPWAFGAANPAVASMGSAVSDWYSATTSRAGASSYAAQRAAGEQEGAGPASCFREESFGAADPLPAAPHPASAFCDGLSTDPTPWWSSLHHWLGRACGLPPSANTSNTPHCTRVAHLSFPIQFTLAFDPRSAAPTQPSHRSNTDAAVHTAAGVIAPVLLLTAISRDAWDRHVVRGYGAYTLPLAAGSQATGVSCWLPHVDAHTAERDFFLGGAIKLSDAQDAAIPDEVATQARRQRVEAGASLAAMSAGAAAAVHGRSSALDFVAADAPFSGVTLSRLGLVTRGTGEVGVKCRSLVERGSSARRRPVE